MATIVGRRLGLSCAVALFALAGCGGSTESPVGSDSGTKGGKDTGVVQPGHDGGHTTPTGDAGHPKDATPVKDVGTTTMKDTGTTPMKDGGMMMKHDGGFTPPPPTDAALNPDSPAACSEMAPTDLTACTTAGLTCDYGDTICACGMTMKWACHVCPTTMPTTGAMCTGAGGGGGAGGAALCDYGATDCVCTGGMWACGSCPTTEPAAMSACTVPGETCGFDAGTCRCGKTGGGMGMGGMDEWECTQSCPTAEPDAGSACTLGAMQKCAYGMASCTCVAGVYSCT